MNSALSCPFLEFPARFEKKENLEKWEKYLLNLINVTESNFQYLDI